MISVGGRGSQLESYEVIVSSESFADSSRADIVERHVQCAQSPIHLAESAAQFGRSRLEYPINFGSRNEQKSSNYCLRNHYH